MATAALYIRLSKEDEVKQCEEDESESIKNQRLLLIEYASTHGYEIYNIYVDEDYSGLYDTSRPAFDQMLRDARRHKFDTILCKSQNRFSRNMEHIEKYLHKEFPMLGIRFIGILDGTDTSNHSGKKARQIYGLVNEWYCEDLSQNIRAVFQKKMKEGQYLSSFAAFGYKKSEEDHHKIVIDEVAASYVRKIYELYLDGNGVGKVARILTEQRIPTPVQYKEMQGLKYKTPNSRYSQNGIWSVSTVKRILSNPIYIGTLIQGRECKISYKEKKVVVLPKEKWHIIENNHEPIIETEVFQKVQDMLRTRRKSCGSYKEDTVKADGLAGKLVCGTCKQRLYKASTSRSKAYDYYMCQLYKRSNGTICSRHAVRSDEMERIAIEQMNKVFSHYITSKQRVSLNNHLRSERKRKVSVYDGLLQEKESLLRAISNLYIDYANGTLTKADQMELLSILHKSLEKLESKILQYESIKESDNNIDCCNVQSLDPYLIDSLLDSVEVNTKEDSETIKLIFFWKF